MKRTMELFRNMQWFRRLFVFIIHLRASRGHLQTLIWLICVSLSKFHFIIQIFYQIDQVWWIEKSKCLRFLKGMNCSANPTHSFVQYPKFIMKIKEFSLLCVPVTVMIWWNLKDLDISIKKFEMSWNCSEKKLNANKNLRYLIQSLNVWPDYRKQLWEIWNIHDLDLRIGLEQ